jgi:lysophospholipase L1-like esterase
MPLSPRKQVLFWAVTLLLPVLCGAAAWSFWQWRRVGLMAGKELNKFAWDASFRERGLPVPPGGPRDGLWGHGIPRQVQDPVLGWHEAEVHRPGLVDEDAQGVQRLPTDGARASILVLGASVAWGAYASSLAETYFAQLAEELRRAGTPVDVTVVAAGAWTSDNELKALRLHAPGLRPDVVLFLDGLNDLTEGPETSENARVLRYLDHLHEGRDVAETLGARVLLALQPTLTGKRHKTRIERRILELMAKHVASVPTAFPRMRAGLRGLEDARGTRFVDCSDAFSGESATTFTDIWHFADPGHRLLSRCIGETLVPMVREAVARR